jgi:hypothetical protein
MQARRRACCDMISRTEDYLTIFHKDVPLIALRHFKRYLFRPVGGILALESALACI